MELLNKFSPLKKKYIRANYSKFLTKELSKTIMLRSKLRNQFLKTKYQEFISRISRVSITRKSKKKLLQKFGSERYYR